MPELPDIELYLSLLRRRVEGRHLTAFKTYSPFVLRSVTPAPREVEGQKVTELRRLGKRIAIGFSGDLFIIVHLMIAGRFRWMDGAGETKLGGKIAVAALTFDNGTLYLTEAGSKKRASITIVRGKEALMSHDPGGIDVMTCSPTEFRKALLAENHTVKDVLTNPHVFSGVGNAYSDEILHAARIPPHRMSKSLNTLDIAALFLATRTTLEYWTERLQAEFGDRFPGAGDITAFRPDFAVHGKFGQPCPVCGRPVQRIRYADNECNYCAQCQNGGRVLADRALSRLLKGDFPRTLDD